MNNLIRPNGTTATAVADLERNLPSNNTDYWMTFFHPSDEPDFSISAASPNSPHSAPSASSSATPSTVESTVSPSVSGRTTVWGQLHEFGAHVNESLAVQILINSSLLRSSISRFERGDAVALSNHPPSPPSFTL